MPNKPFTPEPWKVAGSCHVHPTIDGKFFHVAHVTVADDEDRNPMIAEISSRGHYCSEREAHKPSAEQAGNAQLIAAAPELYAALKDLFEQCAMVHKNWGEGSNQREADAAIERGLAALRLVDE